MNDALVVTRPVGSADAADLARLFEGERNTRRCWCMAFCTTRSQFAIGWLTGGNQHRFETMAAADALPMGVLAIAGGEPVGWCACGPRSRYLVAMNGRSALLAGRDRNEDDLVWLIACLFVRSRNRRQGVTSALIQAAVDAAGRHGATAVESWPTATPHPAPGESFVGRAKLFESHGFRCVDRPSHERVIMRRELPPE